MCFRRLACVIAVRHQVDLERTRRAGLEGSEARGKSRAWPILLVNSLKQGSNSMAAAHEGVSWARKRALNRSAAPFLSLKGLRMAMYITFGPSLTPQEPADLVEALGFMAKRLQAFLPQQVALLGTEGLPGTLRTANKQCT